MAALAVFFGAGSVSLAVRLLKHKVVTFDFHANTFNIQ